MASVTFAIPDEVKSEMKKLSWVNWSELVREESFERLREQLNSKEEQEFIKWSVDLGRRAKKGSFKKLLSEVSPKIREELLKRISPKKKRELLEE